MEKFDNKSNFKYLGGVESTTSHTNKPESSDLNLQTNNVFDKDKICNSETNTNVKCNRIDEINQKSSDNTLIKEYNHCLHRNTGNHELFAADLKYRHSIQSCVSQCKVNDIVKCNSEINNNNDKTNGQMMDSSYRNYTCYRYEDNLKLTNDIKRLTSNEKIFHDKTTYCRPVINYYNEQFIYKTMERNARLTRIVRKLAIARQKEKETVSWNNFINDLKNKHGFNCDDSRLPANEPEEYITPNTINDYYNTKFSCVQSKPCEYLLKEFYDLNDESPSNCTYYRQFNGNSIKQSEVKIFSHDRNPYCYPTSSQGRLIMMDRERQFKHTMDRWPNRLSDKNLYIKRGVNRKYFDGTVNTEVHRGNSISKDKISHNRSMNFNKSMSVQADLKFCPNFISNKYRDKATYKTDDFIEYKYNGYKNVENIQKNNQKPNKILNKISLVNIDTKLETLIESINTFIDELKLNKSRRRKNTENYLKCKNNNQIENINLIENNSLNKVKAMKRPSITSYVSENTFNLNDNQWSSNINEVLQGRNMDNSKSMQISNTFANHPCSVQITFEVPTKDCSTEVTKSLSKQNSCSENKEACIEEISTPEHIAPLQRMTIAVNTDPLSLLGLLKISTDTFKRFLSYMPNLDYYSYLSLLQFPISPRKIEPHYVCNICGADFNRPSQLSDHIRDHNLGKTKDCCVCRHVLDTARKSSGLFRCRYCGQMFARAYCCELHQESCARRLGRHHDVTSSLMLLR